jgi:hypothetical protein
MTNNRFGPLVGRPLPMSMLLSLLPMLHLL